MKGEGINPIPPEFSLWVTGLGSGTRVCVFVKLSSGFVSGLASNSGREIERDCTRVFFVRDMKVSGDVSNIKFDLVI